MWRHSRALVVAAPSVSQIAKAIAKLKRPDDNHAWLAQLERVGSGWVTQQATAREALGSAGVGPYQDPTRAAVGVQAKDVLIPKPLGLFAFSYGRVKRIRGLLKMERSSRLDDSLLEVPNFRVWPFAECERRSRAGKATRFGIFH